KSASVFRRWWALDRGRVRVSGCAERTRTRQTLVSSTRVRVVRVVRVLGPNLLYGWMLSVIRLESFLLYDFREKTRTPGLCNEVMDLHPDATRTQPGHPDSVLRIFPTPNGRHVLRLHERLPALLERSKAIGARPLPVPALGQPHIVAALK